MPLMLQPLFPPFPSVLSESYELETTIQMGCIDEPSVTSLLAICRTHHSVGLRRKLERKRSISLPILVKKSYTGFYDHRANALMGLPETWGTWRRPVVVAQSPVRIIGEPLSTITEDISIGTISLYSLYCDSTASESSPLLSALSQANRGEKNDQKSQPGSPSPLSKSPLLIHSAMSEHYSESVEEDGNGSQLVTMHPAWRQSLYITTRIKLVPGHLLPRRSNRPVSSTSEDIVYT